MTNTTSTLIGFWSLTGCNLLVVLIFYFMGYWFQKRTPEINPIFGFRTARSMMNEDTWKFAHDLSGKVSLKMGHIALAGTIIVSIVSWFYRDSDAAIIIGTAWSFVLCGILVGIMVYVENALKKTFDDEGKRRIPEDVNNNESIDSSSDKGTAD